MFFLCNCTHYKLPLLFLRMIRFFDVNEGSEGGVKGNFSHMIHMIPCSHSRTNCTKKIIRPKPLEIKKGACIGPCRPFASSVSRLFSFFAVEDI